MTFAWTDERIEAMADMRADKKSYGQIADVLGVSRNACLGKAGRLRADGDARFGEPTNGPSVKPAPRPQPIQLPRVTVVSRPKASATSWSIRQRAIEPLPLFDYVAPGRTRSIIELSLRECRYVLHDGTYCACHTLPGRSYCRDHAKIIYVPTRKAA